MWLVISEEDTRFNIRVEIVEGINGIMPKEIQ
jgi:hypothetical protein